MSDEGAGPDPAEVEVSWRPWPGRRWCYAVGGAVALILAVRSEDGGASGSGPAFAVVAVVLAVLAGLDAWYGTPLKADAAGLRLRRGPRRVTTIPWSHIDRIESTTTSRGLLRLTSLEIDDGEQLLLLSRHRLGADPEEVAAELRRRWPNSPRPPRP